MKNDEISYNLGDTVDRPISLQYFMSGGGSALKDSIMGPSQQWIHQRSLAEDLVSRWAKSIVDSEKEFFSK